MANVVIYDKNANPQKVLQYLQSVNTPDYSSRDDVVINPNVNNIINVPVRYWKHVTGSIFEMTAGEKTAIDAAIEATFDAFVRSSAKGTYDGFNDIPLALRSFAAIATDEFNIVRHWTVSFKAEVAAATTLADLKTRVSGLPTLDNRTLSQLKTAIKNKIDSSTIDEK